ncbi:hypothetical protein MK139_02290 [bacterium]|nr:hypothetical protein [bacterium]
MIRRPYRLFIVAAFLLLPVSDAPADNLELEKKGYVVLAAHEGERCLVSGILLDENGIAFIYRGRRVTLHPDAIGVFLSQPDRYFSHLKPKGALFQEHDAGSIAISWLGLGIWMTLGLICGAVGSHIAIRKGRSPGYWFAAGVVLNLVALTTLLTRPSAEGNPLPDRLDKIPVTSAPVNCPSCIAPNHPTASTCFRCGRILTPSAESEVKRT